MERKPSLLPNKLSLRLVSGALAGAAVLTSCSAQESESAAREISVTNESSDQHTTATPTPDLFQAESTVRPIDPAFAARMEGVTLRDYPGCATLEQLRLVEVPYRNFEGQSTMGSLVIRHEIAEEVGEIFEEIYATGFEIERVATAEEVEEIDMRSQNPEVGVEIDNILMDHNITSAFNCRTLDGEPSRHGMGNAVAIDINPLQNPMIIPNPFTTPNAPEYEYSPPAAEGVWDIMPDEQATLSRELRIGEQVIRIFTSRGWRWGGDWNSLYDGQHFDKVV